MQSIRDFALSLNGGGNPTIVSDNPAFDFAFLNYYMHAKLGENIFGWSARRIGDLFCGVEQTLWYQWKRHRRTKHDHNPLHDALGNVEALEYLFEKYPEFKTPWRSK